MGTKEKMGTNTAQKDELDEIMDELEKLQKEVDQPAAAPGGKSAPDLKLVSSAPAKAAAAPAPKKTETTQPSANAIEDFRNKGSDEASLEETLAELKDDQPENQSSLLNQSILKGGAFGGDSEESMDMLDDKEGSVPHPMSAQFRKKSKASQEPTVDLQLSGDLRLHLSCQYEGQEVLVSFSQGFLHVEFSDGTELKIPIRGTAAR